MQSLQLGEVANRKYLLICCLLAPLCVELFVLLRAPVLHKPLRKGSGSFGEDDDFGFLVLPRADWMTKQREWGGFVDIDESLLQQQHDQERVRPLYIKGDSLKSQIRALSGLPETRGVFSQRLDAHRADILARQNPPPLLERVPKIIHQTWKSHLVQSVFENYTSSWKRVLPEWEYWFWTDNDVKQLVEVSYPRHKEWYESFDGYASFIQKADTWKYLALYAFGGVYADLDVEALKPFDESLMSAPLLLSTEPHEHSWILNKQQKTVCNAFMSSVPSHPFWLHVLDTIRQRTHVGDPVDSTGPRMLQTVLDKYNTQREGAMKLHSNISHIWRKFPAVVTAPPELYMPFFDQSPVRQKCETEYTKYLDVRPFGDELSVKAAHLCSELRRRNYTYVVPEASFTIHHWSHTWLGHVKDRIYYDISSQISVGKNWTKSLPQFESEEVWVEKLFLWDAATTNVERSRKQQAERVATNW